MKRRLLPVLLCLCMAISLLPSQLRPRENGPFQHDQEQQWEKAGTQQFHRRGVHTMLHSTLDRAVKERPLIRNPADGCAVRKVQHHDMKTPQPEDLKAP